MNRLLAALPFVPASFLLAGCGTAASSQLDPQQPLPADRADAPSRVVICPTGSTYDPSRNVCVATSAVRPGAPSSQPGSSSSEAGQGDVSVRCTFSNGWVALLPVQDYPADDGFLMQALIGMNEDPDFWANESDYASLRGHAAKRCTGRAERFRVAPGAYYVLAGEAGTFARRGRYQRNGYKRRIQVTRAEPLNVTIEPSDLTHTWDCISCPFVAFLDPWAGRYRPSFVILEHRASSAREGTDRRRFENVAVRNGKIRLRVVEAEPEVSRIDQLVLVSEGRTLLPVQGAEHSALASVDGVRVELSRGRQIDVEYEVPGVGDGTIAVDVIAHGYYDPIGP